MKARLVLLFVLCAVIMVTAVLTWRVSIKSTDKYINSMSAQLREDVTRCAVVQLKDLLLGITVTIRALRDFLSTHVQEYSRDFLRHAVLPALWSTFRTHTNATTVFLTSAQGLIVGYRRNGLEAPLLGNPLVVALPSPPTDPFSILYGYIPDNATGLPNLDGPIVKMCVIGSCPAELDRSVYLPPAVPPLLHPVWQIGRGQPRGKLTLIASIGDMHEPILTAIASIKNSTDESTSAVVSMVFTSSRLRPFLQSVSPVQRFNGRMFITLGHNYNILSASNGLLFVPAAQPGALPSFISALDSSDEVTREAARFLNSTFEDEVFMRPITAHGLLPGHGVYFINSVPLVLEGLQLVVILAVPREKLRGEIEYSRQHVLIVTMVIVLIMFVMGGMAICMSTTGVSKKLRRQGKDLDEAAEANRELAQRLQTLMAPHSAMWPNVDMGTPLEKIRTILKGLKPGHMLTPSQLQQLQALITADDLHKPQFLASMQTGASQGLSSSRSGLSLVDSEIERWIEIVATGRRLPAGTRHSADNLPRPTLRVRRRSSESACLKLTAETAKPPSNLGPSTKTPTEPPTTRTSKKNMAYDVGKGLGMTSTVGRGWQQDIELRRMSEETSQALVPFAESASPLQGAQGDQPLKVDEYNPSEVKDSDPSARRPRGKLLSTRSIRLLVRPAPTVDPSSFQRLQTVALAALFGEADLDASQAGLGLEKSGHTGEIIVNVDRGQESSVGLSSFASQCPDSAPGLPLQRLPAARSRLLEQTSSDGEGSTNSLVGLLDVAPTAATVYDDPFGGGGGDDHKSLVHMLRRLGEWEFDTLALAAFAGGQLVPLVGYSLFAHAGLIRAFGLSELKLMNFLHQVARGMQGHAYHNAAHIADVSASLFHVLTHSGVGDHLRSIDKLAALVAALIHDYKHPGVNNDFLNRMHNDLATVYNDQSPLENFHLAEAFHLLYSNEHCNFLEVLADDEFVDLRRVVIEMVLASDLKRHFAFLDQFKARISQNTPWDAGKESDRILLLQLSLKVADIGHAAKPLPVHLEWSRRVNEEFYLQGDLERAAQLVVSPFMDRLKNNVPKSQLGFFQFLAMPLFEAWAKTFPRATFLLTNMKANVNHWKRELQGA